MIRAFAGLAALAAAVPALAATPEALGSWLLQCPDGPHTACALRLKERLFDKAGLSADLEVRSVGPSLVPVVSVHGLPSDPLLAMALGDRIKADVRFPGAQPADLRCSAAEGGYVCVPKDDAAAGLASALPAARSVGVHVAVSMPGSDSGPSQARTVDLSGTAQALARYRAVGAAAAPSAPQEIPSGWVKTLDSMLRSAGYANGTSDLPGMVQRFLKR